MWYKNIWLLPLWALLWIGKAEETMWMYAYGIFFFSFFAMPRNYHSPRIHTLQINHLLMSYDNIKISFFLWIVALSHDELLTRWLHQITFTTFHSHIKISQSISSSHCCYSLFAAIRQRSLDKMKQIVFSSKQFLIFITYNAIASAKT